MAAVTPRFRAGDGKPLLLVHAALMSWRLWTPLLLQLTAECDVLAPTLPGHLGGPGLPPAGGMNVSELVDHLESELDAAGFDRPDVVGNSLGGWCALELARRGRARRVVAIAPVGMHTSDQGMEWMRLFIRMHARARRTARLADIAMASPLVRQRSLAMIATHGGRLPAGLVRDLVKAVAACELPGRFAEALSSGTAAPSIEQAEDIDVPVLLLWGSEDKLVTRGAGSRA